MVVVWGAALVVLAGLTYDTGVRALLTGHPAGAPPAAPAHVDR